MIKNKIPFFFIALLIAGGLTGCAVKKPVTDPAMDKKAKAKVHRARAFNNTIVSTKGTGHITLVNGRGAKKETYKMAWAAKAPNQLRLTLMTAGLPVETIAANGKKVTFVSHTGHHQTYTTHIPDPNLNAFIGVPVRLSEMITLLLGQVPIRAFDRAWMVPGQPGRIHTNKNVDSKIQELEISTDAKTVALRLLDRHLTLVYGMKINAWRQQQDWEIPVSVSVYDSHNRRLEITLSTITPNPPVEESIFILTGTGS